MSVDNSCMSYNETMKFIGLRFVKSQFSSKKENATKWENV